MDRQMHDKDKDRGQRLATVEQKGAKETESGGIASETFEFDISTAIHL